MNTLGRQTQGLRGLEQQLQLGNGAAMERQPDIGAVKGPSKGKKFYRKSPEHHAIADI